MGISAEVAKANQIERESTRALPLEHVVRTGPVATLFRPSSTETASDLEDENP